MKKLLVGATVLATLSLAACNHNQTAGDNYASLVSEAQQKQEIARQSGNVWQQRRMKLPYVDHYLAEAEKARQESVRLANEAVDTANAQLDQSSYAAELRPGWYKD